MAGKQSNWQKANISAKFLNQVWVNFCALKSHAIIP